MGNRKKKRSKTSAQRRRHLSDVSKRSGTSHPGRGLAKAVLESVSKTESFESPIELEMVLSRLFGQIWGESEVGKLEIVGEAISTILDNTRTNDPNAGLLLAGLASVAPPDSRARVAEFDSNCSISDRNEWKRPDWFDLIGRAELVEGFTVTDIFGDQRNYLLAFSYPGIAPAGDHVVLAMPDYNLHLVKDMMVMPGHEALASVSDLIEPDFMKVAEVDRQFAANDLTKHLTITDLTVGPPFSDTSAESRFLVGARVAALAAAQEVDSEPMADAERRNVVNAYLRSASARDLLLANPQIGLGQENLRSLIQMFVDFAVDYGVGDPQRWSPIAVEVFLVDWAPSKVVWEAADLPAVPVVLRDFVAWCGRRTKLPKTAWGLTVAAVDKLTEDFLTSAADPATDSSSTAILRQMMADGVQPDDPDQMNEWIANYNANLPPIDHRPAR